MLIFTPFSQTRPFLLQTKPSSRIWDFLGGGHLALQFLPLILVKEYKYLLLEIRTIKYICVLKVCKKIDVLVVLS